MANTFTPALPISGPWYIDREDCIGDSLQYLNANTNYLGVTIQNVNNNLNSKINALSAQVPPFPQTSITFITPQTEVNIIVDTTSLGQTAPRVREMFGRYLPSVLLPSYGNNITLYNQRVRQFDYNSERSFSNTGIARGPSSGSITRVVNILFQDEANDRYHPSNTAFFPTNARTSSYNTDIGILRTLINSYPANTFKFLSYGVRTAQDQLRKNFADFMFSVYNGVGNYSGTNGLSDKRDLCFYRLDVDHDAAPSYYAELLKNDLITL
jgi:hypothetical protein